MTKQDTEILLPPQVIRHLIEFVNTGCTLKMVHEDFEGTPVVRWIANDNVVIWTEEQQR